MMHCSVFGTAVACFHVMDMLGSYTTKRKAWNASLPNKVLFK